MLSLLPAGLHFQPGYFCGVHHLRGVDFGPQAHGLSAVEYDSQHGSKRTAIVTVDSHFGMSQTLDEGHHPPCHQVDLVLSFQWDSSQCTSLRTHQHEPHSRLHLT